MSSESPESRYRLDKILGQGASATTWLAIDTHHHQPCALKKLHLAQMASWQELERFEREIAVLRHLDHPGIPRFLDAWQSNEPPEAVLVQEYLPGRNLRQWIESGRRFTESEVIQIAVTLSGILIYLHGFSPPVIHRDLKPSNILLDEQGTVHLVDFDAVAKNLNPGLTVTGTFGYMPLEQVEGRAVPASDLYALGATMVYLLTGQSPGELPKKGLKPDFRSHTRLSEKLCRLLDKLLEQDQNLRYTSAAQLQGDLLRLTQPPVSPLTQLNRTSRMLAWPKVALAGGVILLLGICVMALVRQPAPQPGKQSQDVSNPARLGKFSSWQTVTDQPAWQRLEPAPIIDKLTLAPDGEVWAISGSQLFQFQEKGAQSWAGNDLIGSFSSLKYLSVPKAGEVWFGTYDSKLFRYTEGRASEMPAPSASDKLSALSSWQQAPVAAYGSSIWHWNGTRFQSLGHLPGSCELLAVDATGRLLAASGRSLYRYDGSRWIEMIAAGETASDWIRVLAVGPKQFWLGLDKGLIEFSLARSLSAKLSPNLVSALISQPDKALWYASNDIYAQGLNRLAVGAREPQLLGWRDGLPDDRFPALLLDQADHLWLSGGTARGGQLWKASVSVVETLMAKPKSTKLRPFLSFNSACEAWQQLGPKAQTQLAGDSRDGRLRVFWNQYQVCPYGSGYRREDGAMLVTGSNELQIWHGARLTRLSLPEPYVSIHSLLLGSDDSVYLMRTFPYVVDQFTNSSNAWTTLKKGYAGNTHSQLLEIAPAELLAAGQVDHQLPLQRLRAGSWKPLNLSASETYTQPRQLLRLRSGELALATDRGLYLISADYQQVRRLEGLAYEDVQAVTEDDQGRLWIIYNPYGKGRGLSVWNPKDGQIRHLDARSGLVPDRFVNLALDSENRLWLEHQTQRVNVYEIKALEAL